MKQAVGRNDPCPCGSGKKYKKCCGSPKLSSRTIAHVKDQNVNLHQRISGVIKDGIAPAPNSLAGRVFTASNIAPQEKD